MKRINFMYISTAIYYYNGTSIVSEASIFLHPKRHPFTILAITNFRTHILNLLCNLVDFTKFYDRIIRSSASKGSSRLETTWNWPLFWRISIQMFTFCSLSLSNEEFLKISTTSLWEDKKRKRKFHAGINEIVSSIYLMFRVVNFSSLDGVVGVHNETEVKWAWIDNTD